MAKPRSFRTVLTLWYSVVIAGGLVVFGLSVYLYLDILQERALTGTLVEEVDWIHQIINIEREFYPRGRSIEALSLNLERSIIDHFSRTPQNYIVILSSIQGQLLYRSERRSQLVLPDMPRPRDTTFVWTVEDPNLGRLRVAVRQSDPFVIQVAYPETASRAVLQRLLTIFAILTPVVLFLAFAGGWFLTGTLLTPLRRISRAAQRITAENLSERIPERRVNDELGELITTMNNMIGRLQASFEQMREFLMNVAHELKTPLTIVKGGSELALSRRLSTTETRELVSSHLRESIRMSRLVDDLLLLAKADAGQLTMARTPVDLHALLEELYEDAQILASEAGHTVETVSTPPCGSPATALASDSSSGSSSPTPCSIPTRAAGSGSRAGWRGDRLR